MDLVGLLVYDPKEFNDPQVFDDPKVYGDTSIFDDLVGVVYALEI